MGKQGTSKTGEENSRTSLSIQFKNCDWSRHIQESRRPLGPKSPKSLNMVFPRLLARSVKKVSKKSQLTRKRVKKTAKSVFGDFFGAFLTLPAGEAREVRFETFWGFRGSGVWRLLYMGIAHAIQEHNMIDYIA